MSDLNSLKKVHINKLTISTLYEVGSRSSLCWKYFGDLLQCESHKRKILNSDYVYCAACLDEVKEESGDNVTFGTVKVKCYNKSVSTSNLMRHLRDDHRLTIDQPVVRPKKGPKTPKKGVSARTRSRTSKSLAKNDYAIAKDIATWLCTSLIPFDSVSDAGMMNFFKKYGIIVKEDQLPSRAAVSGPALTFLYETVLKNVKYIMARDAPQCSALTFDTWTDQHRQLNYVTLSLHYLTSDFNLKAMTLRTQNIAGKKPQEKLNAMIEDVKREFELDNKTIHAVTDNSGVVRQAVLRNNMVQHLCLGHGLHNLVVVDGISSIPAITTLVKKCKNIIKAIRYQIPFLEMNAIEEHEEFFENLDKVAVMIDSDDGDPIEQSDFTSVVNTESGQEAPSPSKENNVPSVKTTIPTRWHIILEMIECLINECNKDKLNNILKKNSQNELKLTKSECNLLGELVGFLKRFREVVEIVSQPTTCTLNVALVFRSEITDILNSVLENESFVMLSLKRNMLANVDKRFPVTKSMVAAALLDTRFTCLHEVDSYLETLMVTKSSFLASCVKEIIEDSAEVEDVKVKLEPVESPPSTSNNDSILTKLSLKHSVGTPQVIPEDPVEQECWRYLASADPTEPKDGNLFSFWNEKKKMYPLLSGLARNMLCVPATSSASEKMFSEVGLALSAKRLRLNPISINKILFIHDNQNKCL